MEEGTKEWRELTFSQRAGTARLPEAVQLNTLTRKFRLKLWEAIDISFSIAFGSEVDYAHNESYAQFWQSFLHSFSINVLEKPHDETRISRSFKDELRSSIFDGGCHYIFSMVECMLRQTGIPLEFRDALHRCFDKSICAYFINEGDPLCIMPSTSEENMEQLKSALENINNSDLTGTKTHLRNATEQLNKKCYADSIRDSMHAVESAVRLIDPNNSKNFSQAITTLKKEGIIEHNALMEAFKKLYGYTCDEEGIRHPLLDNDTANVGFDEAIFMYSACVAFVDFLNSKNQQLKKS